MKYSKRFAVWQITKGCYWTTSGRWRWGCRGTTIIISDGRTDAAAATAPPPLISGDKWRTTDTANNPFLCMTSRPRYRSPQSFAFERPSIILYTLYTHSRSRDNRGTPVYNNNNNIFIQRKQISPQMCISYYSYQLLLLSLLLPLLSLLRRTAVVANRTTAADRKTD